MKETFKEFQLANITTCFCTLHKFDWFSQKFFSGGRKSVTKFLVTRPTEVPDTASHSIPY